MKKQITLGREPMLIFVAGLTILTMGWTDPPAGTDRYAAPDSSPFVDERGATDVAAFNASLDPDVIAYIAHDTTLANPFMEGRAPGTNGNRVAAQYIEFWFQYWGLEPAFPEYDRDGQVVGDADHWVSYRQPFHLPGRVSAVKELFSYKSGEGDGVALKAGSDFHALGVGDGTVTAPLSFVGYGITNGPDGYDSFDDVDLSGTIAVLLRFEPSGDDGVSQWNNGQDGWSGRAALDTKLAQTAQHGAAGIILVAPPGTHDARANQLLTAEDSAWRNVGVPVVQLSQNAADALLRAASGGQGLAEFKAKADGQDATSERLGEAVQVTIDTQVDEGRIPTDNVGGVLRGKGDLADEWVIIGGHYDHLGYGRFGSMSGRRGDGVIHPGADDNASGTSAVLMLAQRLSKAYSEMGPEADARSILFMGFSAEESGLIGSRYYTSHATLKPDQVNIMLNLDMVGRMRNHKLQVTGTGTAEGLADLVQPFFDRSGLVVRSQTTGSGPSDHASFFNVGIPVLFFFTGLHPQYHRPADVPSLINPVGAMQVVDLAQALAVEFAQMPEPLKFVRATGPFRLDLLDADEPADAPPQASAEPEGEGPAPGTRIGVRLGIQPNYDASTSSGVLLEGVSAESPAEKGGLKAGDRIISWNGRPVTDIRSLMNELSGHSAGDVVKIGVKREGSTVYLNVTLEASEG